MVFGARIRNYRLQMCVFVKNLFSIYNNHKVTVDLKPIQCSCLIYCTLLIVPEDSTQTVSILLSFKKKSVNKDNMCQQRMYLADHRTSKI